MKLGSLLGRNTPALIGMDVSTSSIKVVELGQADADGYALEHCAIEPLEPDWVVDGNIEKFDEIVDAGRRALRSSGSRARQVAMAMPASVVISRKIVLPADLSEREMEVQVEMEANQYIPFSLDEVSLDFCVIGPSKFSVGDVEVMIAASRREKVEDRQALAEAMGLTPVVIEVETNASRLAAQRVVSQQVGAEESQVIALFELGGPTSAMQVFRDQDLMYEREQVFGGAQLTQMLVHQYGFTPKEAEAKKRAGDLPSDYNEVVLAPYVDVLADQIEGALKLFFTSTPNNHVDWILLGGGSAVLDGLADAISDRTSTRCDVIDPFDGMVVPRRLIARGLRREAPSYLTACGLAMRRHLS